MIKRIILGVVWFIDFSRVGTLFTGMIYAMTNRDVPRQVAMETLQMAREQR